MSNYSKLANGIDISNPDAVDYKQPLHTFSGFETNAFLLAWVKQHAPELLNFLLPHLQATILEPQKKKWLTRKQTADYMNISLVTLDGILKKGKLKSYRPSLDRVLVRVEDIDEYLLGEAV